MQNGACNVSGIEKTRPLCEESKKLSRQFQFLLWRELRVEALKGLRGSLATFTALDGEKPVGMAHLLGDGGMSFYVKDFAVLPAYQSQGVGSLLMETAERWIQEQIPPDWAVSLELISTKEAVPFYKKLGFEERPCEWDGPGMMKMFREIRP